MHVVNTYFKPVARILQVSRQCRGSSNSSYKFVAVRSVFHDKYNLSVVMKRRQALLNDAWRYVKKNSAKTVIGSCLNAEHGALCALINNYNK